MRSRTDVRHQLTKHSMLYSILGHGTGIPRWSWTT